MKNFVERNLFKHEVCLASLIHNADMVLIDLRDAGVPITSTFIQQHVVFCWPGSSLVKAHLNHLIHPPLLRMAIAEKQRLLHCALLLEIDLVERAVTARFNQRVAVCRMRLPGVSHLTPHPACGTKDFSGVLIDYNSRITTAVAVLWQSTVLPHVHNHPNRFPGTTAIGAAHQSNINVFLQVTPFCSPYVESAQQRALRGYRQGRDS